MGPNEKHKVKELQDGAIPERTRELLEITGSPVAYAAGLSGAFSDNEIREKLTAGL